MQSKKIVIRLAVIALCGLLLSACGTAQSEAKETGTPAPTADAGLRMSQAETVHNAAYEGEAAFSDFLNAASPKYLIPGLHEAMTPQGLGSSSETGLLYISDYASGETPSALTAVDCQTGAFVAEYYLYNPDGTAFVSHVGGVAVADDTLYVSAKLDSDGSYSIAAIPLADLPASGSHDVTVSELIPMAVSPSFLSYDDGILWVGNFYHPDGDYNLSPEMNYTTATADGESGCYILGFDMSAGPESLAIAEGEDYPIPDHVLVAPDKVQGMVYSGGTVLLSQSYGRKNNSSLLQYALDLNAAEDTKIDLAGHKLPAYILDSGRLIKSITAMPMTEALCTAPDGNTLVLFESGALQYSSGTYRTDHIWELVLN